MVRELKQFQLRVHFTFRSPLWCMPYRHSYSSSAASASRAPADRTRDRSRSPGPRDPITPEKLEQLKETYRKCKVQKRGGDKHRRRLKGVRCGLLRFLIQLCIEIVQNCSSATDPRIDIYKKRQRQAERRLQEVIDGWLPRRDENILDLGEDSEAESEIREEVAISSEEEEEEQEPETLAGVWFDSSSDLSSRIRSAPRISASNPLLVRSHQQQQRQQQQLVNHALLERHGVRCNPEVRYKLEGLVISLDWHQVCDTVRTQFKTLRTSGDWYYILDPIRERLTYLRSLSIPVTVFILSYNHSEKYSQLVQNLWPWEQDFIDVAVTTRERTGRGGKVWAIEHLCKENSKVWHVDDNIDICREICGRPRNSPVTIRAAGIKVPTHWKRQREFNQVFWYKNVLDALDGYTEALVASFPNL